MEDEKKIIRMPKLNFDPDPRGVGCVLFDSMQKHKNKIAQIDGLTGEKDTYDSLLQRCTRTAITMQSKGIKSGDIVTLCTFNHLNSCVPFFATFFIGATTASLDPTLSLDDTVHLLKQVTPKIIFVVPDALKMIEKAIEDVPSDIEIVVFGNTTKYTPFSEFIQPNKEEYNFKPSEAKSLEDTSIIFFSSGTSGLPKGICVSHYALLCQFVVTTMFGYCPDVILAYASLYWISSVLFWGVAVTNGTSRLILPKFDASAVWGKIDQYKPTVMFLCPSQILAMYTQGRPDGIDTSSLKDITLGGGPLSEENILKIRKILPGTRVCLCYGQTEAVGYLTCVKPSDPKDMNMFESKVTTVGTGLPGISYKVVDSETEEILGPNQKGELRWKADFALSGYYHLPSTKPWDDDGWVKSGDIVYYDDELCFYVVDRLKEMLKFQSFHVPPAIIENVLFSHPFIKNAIVIGKPHEIDGDHPMAIVILENSKTNDVSAEEIIKYVEDRVNDRQRLRGGVKIVDHLPVTPTGKVKRQMVKELYL